MIITTGTGADADAAETGALMVELMMIVGAGTLAVAVALARIVRATIGSGTEALAAAGLGGIVSSRVGVGALALAAAGLGKIDSRTEPEVDPLAAAIGAPTVSNRSGGGAFAAAEDANGGIVITIIGTRAEPAAAATGANRSIRTSAVGTDAVAVATAIMLIATTALVLAVAADGSGNTGAGLIWTMTVATAALDAPGGLATVTLMT